MNAPSAPKKRGFAAMSPEARRRIASKGGKSVPAEKRTFSTNKVLAAEAGGKGGRATRERHSEVPELNFEH